MTNKHIVISPASYDHLDALAKNWRMDKKEFTEHIINYFRLTGDDPTATKRDNTVLALKKLQDTFVSFIRKHETDHLKKIVDDFEATRKKLEQDQVSQTSGIKTAIETGITDTQYRLDRWIYFGKNLVDKKGVKATYCVKDQFDKLVKMDEKTAELLAGIDAKMDTKMEKKRQVLTTRMDQMKAEIVNWSMSITGNKDKFTALLEDLKTLVNGTY